MHISEERKSDITRLIDKAISDGAFPCASVMVGNRNEVLFEYAAGYRSVYPKKQALTNETLFDMASLTKVIATTPLAMVFVEKGLISLADKLCDYIPQFSEGAGADITLGHLLTHTAGLAPHLPLHKTCNSFDDAIIRISEEGVRYKPGEQVLYSDLGFILMGHILEMAGGSTLADLCKEYIYSPANMVNTGFNPTSDNIAATEKDPDTGNWICGTVHDENARFFGGISGHAGLFSNAADLSKYAVMLLDNGIFKGRQILSAASVEAMSRNYTYQLSEDRGLGWCIKTDRIPGMDSYSSSAGELFSPGSFGHTGFTGTSLWIDKALDIYVICLTNRVHYGRDNVQIIRFRRLLHNLVISSLGI